MAKANNMTTFMFGMQDKVQDVATGYKGVVTGLAVYRDGSKYAAVTTNLVDKGQFTEWIHEGSLKPVK